MPSQTSFRLPLIILAQLFGTASWFAGNAVLPALVTEWNLPEQSLAWVTNSVQFGFVVGTLCFALLSLADRFSPTKVFLVCALLSAGINLVTAIGADHLYWILLSRFLVGVLLAGIYPVGMKIAASWYPEGLGRALGYLVGALAFGTALPHLFAVQSTESWSQVLIWVSIVNLISGAMIFWGVGDGPHRAKPARVQLSQIKALVEVPKLRASALGYFGHMWELYAVWAIAPLWLLAWSQQSSSDLNLSLAVFAVIAIGALGCALGGLWSQRIGSARVASLMLLTSGVCCMISPLVFEFSPIWVALFWAVWGFSVVADSPQFSALSAQNAPADRVGTALTLINSIGFTLTLVSIQLLVAIQVWIPVQWSIWLLLPGPLLGWLAMRPLRRLEVQARS